MESSKRKVLILVGVIMLLLIIVGITYAYFQSGVGDAAIGNVNVTTGTTDSLTFNVSDIPELTVTQGDFGEGGGNKQVNATTTATLKANNETNTATMNYYLYLDITKNNFVYTSKEQTAELILTVT